MCLSQHAPAPLRAKYKDRLVPSAVTAMYRGVDRNGVEVANPRVWAFDVTGVALSAMELMCGRASWEYDYSAMVTRNLPAGAEATCKHLASPHKCGRFALLAAEAARNRQLPLLQALANVVGLGLRTVRLTTGWFSSQMASSGPSPALLLDDIIKAAGWRNPRATAALPEPVQDVVRGAGDAGALEETDDGHEDVSSPPALFVATGDSTGVGVAACMEVELSGVESPASLTCMDTRGGGGHAGARRLAHQVPATATDGAAVLSAAYVAQQLWCADKDWGAADVEVRRLNAAASS